MAALMQQHVAVDALVALRPEAPYPASAAATGHVLNTRSSSTGEQGHVIIFIRATVNTGGEHAPKHAHVTHKLQQRYLR